MPIFCPICMRVVRRRGKNRQRAFTILEVLVVCAIIVVLGLTTFSAASRAKEKAQTIRCQNQLRQTGLAMAVYLTDSRCYPPMWDENSCELWADKLYVPRRAAWTNVDWNCPKYNSKRGTLGFLDKDNIAVSYSYNWRGTAGGWSGRAKGPLPAASGLGHLSKDEVTEPEVATPSEMYAVADVRGTIQGSQLSGNPKMSLYRFSGVDEAPPPHESGYSILFADGHVALIKRAQYLFPPMSAHSWNRDNQPHIETWAPSSEWAVITDKP